MRYLIASTLIFIYGFTAFGQVSDTIYAVRGDLVIMNNTVHKIKADTIIFVNKGDTYQHILKSITRNDMIYDSLAVKAGNNLLLKGLHIIFLRSGTVPPIDSNLVHLRSEDYYSEYTSKVIRNIYIKRLSIFGPSVTDTLSVPANEIERFINKYHMNTRLWVIRNYLMVESGDILNPNVLADNERFIRQQSNIHDAKIYVKEIPNNIDSVDLEYVIQDTYALGFGVNISDWNAGNIDLWHNNVLGTGIEFYNSYLWNDNRPGHPGYEGRLRMKNILGSYFNTSIVYKNALSENSFLVDIERPFFSPNISYIGGLSYGSSSYINNIQTIDSVYTDQKIDFDNFDIWVGKAIHLTPRYNLSANNRYNLIFSTRFLKYKFKERPQIGRDIFYDYEDRSIYLSSVTLAAQSYIKNTLIYSFGITEDIPHGFSVKLTFGYEISELSKRNYCGINFDYGKQFVKDGYIHGSLSLGGFYNQSNQNIEQGILVLDGGYFTKLYKFRSNYTRFFFDYNYTLGINRYDDEYINLGGKSYISGLSSDKLRGTERLVIKFESVTFTKLYLYGFRFAFFGFSSFGAIAKNNENIFYNTFYSNVGIGLRLRNEHLVFRTIQVKLSYYPFAPAGSSLEYFDVSSTGRKIQEDFNQVEPKIIDFN